MIKEIIFYSNVHLGDLHLARPFIKWFADNFVEVKVKFDHNYSPKVFKDIKNVEFSDFGWHDKLPREGDIFCNDEEGIYIFNTWAYSGGLNIGCNYIALQNLFKKYFNFLISKDERFQHISFPSQIEAFVPKIDFTSDQINKNYIDHFFKDAKWHKKIYVSNNYVASKQADNFNMNQLILEISNKFPDTLLILSNKIDPLLLDSLNIIYAQDLVDSKVTDNFDMLEQSYISTFCDIILGRNSGPFTFAEVDENRNKTWITMLYSHINYDAFNLFNIFSHSSEYYHEYNINNVMKILDYKCKI